MPTYKAVIIDDEPRNRELLELMLLEYCPSVEVVGKAADLESGVRLVKHQRPDVVFLDIRLSKNDEGFEFFAHFPASKAEFEVVFVTAREEYILRAFNQTFAIGYLLKPIDPDELIQVVFKIKQKTMATRANDYWLDERFRPNDVLYAYIKDETVRIRLVDGRESIARSNRLEDYEEYANFVRINRQYVVNLAFANKLTDIDEMGEKMRGATVILFNGEKLSVSVNRKSAFQRIFEQYSA